MKAERSHCQWKKMLIPWLHFVFLVLCAGLQAPSKGRSSPFSVVDQCSGGSWAIRAVFYFGSIGIIALNSFCVKRENKIKHEAKFPFHPQDIQFNSVATLFCFVLFFFIVMTLSSAFGIGGGFIIVLFFYRYRMHPQVASETMVVILFYMLLASSIQFAIEDRVPWFYALWNTLYGILGTFTGVFVIEKVVKKTGRTSIVVILVACLVALATILIPVIQIMRFDQIAPY